MENDIEIQEQEGVQENPQEASPEPQAQEDVDWKERALKAEEAIKKAKFSQKQASQGDIIKRTLKTAPEPDDDIRTVVSSLQMAEKKRQFGYENNLSPEEVDAVFQMKPDATKEDLNNPFIKGGLSAIRKEKRLKENIPSPSSNSSFVSKDFQTKSREEKQIEFQKYMKSKFGVNNN